MYFTQNNIYVTEMSELLAREWEHDNAIVQVMFIWLSTNEMLGYILYKIHWILD